MSILSKFEISRRVNNGEIVIQPYNAARLNPNSYNLSLADKLLIYATNTYYRVGGLVHCVLDAAKENKTEEMTIPEEGLVLEPGTLYLGSTAEWTEAYNLVPLLEGRSSLARLGLQVHLSAGWGDCGFKGHWTLELSVVQPLKIYPGMEICQIAYHTLEGPPDYYRGRYQGQRGPTASRLHQK